MVLIAGESSVFSKTPSFIFGSVAIIVTAKRGEKISIRPTLSSQIHEPIEVGIKVSSTVIFRV